MHKVDDIELAWLAAVIDGEGNLTLYPQRCTNNRGWVGNYVTYRPVVQVINTHHEFVLRAASICMRLGLSFVKVYKKELPKPYKVVYQLQLRGQGAVRELLTAVFPWLIVKRDFAAALLDYLNATRERAEAKRPMPETEIKWAEEIRAKFMPRSKAVRANGETPDHKVEAIPCQAKGSAKSTLEGVETRSVRSVTNKPAQECPGSSMPKFPPKRKETHVLEDREIVRHLSENWGRRINNGGVRN